MSDDFHQWAKDAGDKLRAYIPSYAPSATAVFFLALTGKDVGPELDRINANSDSPETRLGLYR